MKTKIIAIIAAVQVSLSAHAAPVYSVNEYGLVAHKDKVVEVAPYVGAFVGYGLHPEGITYEAQLGLNSLSPNGYSVDVGLYHAVLASVGGAGQVASFGTMTEKLPVKGYGLKSSFNIPFAEKSQFSVTIGSGFVYSGVRTVEFGKVDVEGAQVSMGLGYGYRFSKNVTLGANYDHYFLSAGIDAGKSWDSLGLGVKFLFK